MKSRRLSIMALTGLLVGSLACTLGSTPANQTQAPQPPGAPTQSQVQPQAVDTVPPIAVTSASVDSSPTQQPTDNSTETNMTTTTPDNTVTATNKPPTATKTQIPVTKGPLAFTYEVVTISRLADNQAALTVHIIATGGAGGYKYYNDEILEPGDTFDVTGTCGHPFTHTFKVQDASGQVVTQQYQVAGKCPTPTPTPT